MGYQDQDRFDHFHEGYVIGLVEESHGLYRELTLRHDGDRHASGPPIPLQWVCVGCECGWRSPRLFAPSGTEWTPCHVWLAHDRDDAVIAGFEEGARKIWREHIAQINARTEPLMLRMDGEEFSRVLREQSYQNVKRRLRSVP
jgi:hypothetical protein